MKVRAYISPRAAIMARRATVGVVSIEILDEHLSDADEVTLSELAAVIEADEVVDLGNGEATPAAVISLMRERASVRAAQEAARAEASEASARLREEQIERDAEAAAHRRRALHRWITEHGTDEQRDRLAEGLLPDEEILEDVTNETIDVDGDDYDPLRRGHACDCDKGCAGAARFSVGPPTGGLDARQFAALQKIREQAPRGAKIEVRLHRVHCPECSCAPLSRLSAVVAVEWEGWRLVKEYALK